MVPTEIYQVTMAPQGYTKYPWSQRDIPSDHSPTGINQVSMVPTDIYQMAMFPTRIYKDVMVPTEIQVAMVP